MRHLAVGRRNTLRYCALRLCIRNERYDRQRTACRNLGRDLGIGAQCFDRARLWNGNIIRAGDFRCAICGLPTPVPSPEQRAAMQETLAQILRCHGCGAAMAYDVKAAAPKCGFCGNVMDR